MINWTVVNALEGFQSVLLQRIKKIRHPNPGLVSWNRGRGLELTLWGRSSCPDGLLDDIPYREQLFISSPLPLPGRSTGCRIIVEQSVLRASLSGMGLPIHPDITAIKIMVSSEEIRLEYPGGGVLITNASLEQVKEEYIPYVFPNTSTLEESHLLPLPELRGRRFGPWED